MNQVVEHTSADVSERVANVVGLLAEQFTGVAKSTGQYMRANPWTAVGAVALLGMAAGMLMARTTRRPQSAGSR